MIFLQMRDERMKGIASKHRDDSVEENLRHFEEMKAGTEERSDGREGGRQRQKRGGMMRKERKLLLSQATQINLDFSRA